MRTAGLLIAPDQFELPLNQKELGSALGMTSVHVNRMLQKLRAEQLVAFHSRTVRIKDLARLHAIAEFDPAYLDLRYEDGSPPRPRLAAHIERDFGNQPPVGHPRQLDRNIDDTGHIFDDFTPAEVAAPLQNHQGDLIDRGAGAVGVDRGDRPGVSRIDRS